MEHKRSQDAPRGLDEEPAALKKLNVEALKQRWRRSPQQVCKRDQAARRFGPVSFTGIPSSNSCPS